MRTIGATEARNRLGALLDRVAAGAATVLTRRGKPVAKLVPVKGGPDMGFDRTAARRAIEGLIEASRGLSLGGLAIKELINQGRS